jgi:D-arabinose 1-dehydrogenase-like Zn-dependent alcohol dehydrogenase
MIQEISLEQVPQYAAELMAGQVTGRIVVKI